MWQVLREIFSENWLVRNQSDHQPSQDTQHFIHLLGYLLHIIALVSNDSYINKYWLEDKHFSSGPTGSGYILVPNNTPTTEVTSTDMTTDDDSVMDNSPDDTAISDMVGDNIEDMMTKVPEDVMEVMEEILKLQMDDGDAVEMLKNFLGSQEANTNNNVPFILKQEEDINNFKQTNTNIDIDPIDTIFTQNDIVQSTNPADVEVELVKDAIEQSEPFPGKRDILNKLTGYQQFGPSWVLQEGYKDMTGDNYKYFYVGKDNRRRGDMFEKISVDMLKNILQTATDNNGFNRRMSYIEYDDYEYDRHNYDQSQNDEYEYSYDDVLDTIDDNYNSHITDVPDDVFGNVLYTMMIGITADKQDAHEIVPMKTLSKEKEKITIETFDKILALPLTAKKSNDAQAVDESIIQEEPSENKLVTFGDKIKDKIIEPIDINKEDHDPLKKDMSLGILGFEADHSVDENLRHMSNNNHIHVDIEQNLYF